MTEQITDKMYMGEPVKDNRPLTDETLYDGQIVQRGGFAYLLTRNDAIPVNVYLEGGIK